MVGVVAVEADDGLVVGVEGEIGGVDGDVGEAVVIGTGGAGGGENGEPVDDGCVLAVGAGGGGEGPVEVAEAGVGDGKGDGLLGVDGLFSVDGGGVERDIGGMNNVEGEGDGADGLAGVVGGEADVGGIGVDG